MRKIESSVLARYENKGKETLPLDHPRTKIYDVGTMSKDELGLMLYWNFQIDRERDPYDAIRGLVHGNAIVSHHEDDLRDLEEKLGDFVYVRDNKERLPQDAQLFREFRTGSIIEFTNFKFPGVPKWMFTLPEQYFRELTLSRSSGMFERESFERFRKTKFLILGMGVGTAIMHALVQHGAEDITCFDGGTVSLHDLNRQNMGMLGQGLNHARFGVEQALLFNPWGNYVAQERNVLLDNRGQFIDLEELTRAELIFEEVDALYIKHKLRASVDRPVMMFTDLGFASARRFDRDISDNPFGLSGEEIEELARMHATGYKGVTRDRMTYFAARMIGSLSNSFLEAQGRVQQHGGNFWHQPKASADRTANFVMRSMVDYFKGSPIDSYELDESGK